MAVNANGRLLRLMLFSNSVGPKTCFIKVASSGITDMVRIDHWLSEGVHQIYLGAAFYAIDGRI